MLSKANKYLGRLDIGHKTWNQKRAPFLYTVMKGDALEGALSTLFALMITLS